MLFLCFVTAPSNRTTWLDLRRYILVFFQSFNIIPRFFSDTQIVFCLCSTLAQRPRVTVAYTRNERQSLSALYMPNTPSFRHQKCAKPTNHKHITTLVDCVATSKRLTWKYMTFYQILSIRSVITKMAWLVTSQSKCAHVRVNEHCARACLRMRAPACLYGYT